MFSLVRSSLIQLLSKIKITFLSLALLVSVTVTHIHGNIVNHLSTMSESGIVLFSLKGKELALAKNIAMRLNISLGEMECQLFANKETNIAIKASVRNKDAYVLQVNILSAKCCRPLFVVC